MNFQYNIIDRTTKYLDKYDGKTYTINCINYPML